jgi:hypothetical protein
VNAIEQLDKDALVEFFNKRIDAWTDLERAYWAGRIDGQCLQNAIGIDQLRDLAYREGFRIDWPSALAVAE